MRVRAAPAPSRDSRTSGWQRVRRGGEEEKSAKIYYSTPTEWFIDPSKQSGASLRVVALRGGKGLGCLSVFASVVSGTWYRVLQHVLLPPIREIAILRNHFSRQHHHPARFMRQLATLGSLAASRLEAGCIVCIPRQQLSRGFHRAMSTVKQTTNNRWCPSTLLMHYGVERESCIVDASTRLRPLPLYTR